MLIPMSLGQQTAAVRALFMKNGTRKANGTRKRVPRAPKRRSAARTRSASSKRGPKRLVKGSAAAKAFMKKIRGMRKR
jgi:hypothetical protein